jgi:hypothetical protein
MAQIIFLPFMASSTDRLAARASSRARRRDILQRQLIVSPISPAACRAGAAIACSSAGGRDAGEQRQRWRRLDVSLAATACRITAGACGSASALGDAAGEGGFFTNNGNAERYHSSDTYCTS